MIQMENLRSLLESLFSRWLGPSSTTWAEDMTLAFACGLGLYLLLLPFLERYLLSPPNIKNVRKTQMQMNLQGRSRKKTGTASRKQPAAQGDHEIKQRVKEKDASFLQENTPGHHLNSSGNMLKSLGSYSRNTGTPSQPSSKTQGLPTQIQQSFKEQLGSGLGLPWMVQRPPEVYDILAPNLSQDLAVSVLPENFPMSPHLRKKPEEHIQKWFVYHQWNFSPSMKESLERRQLQKKLTGPCFARNMQRPSQSSVSRSENSPDVRKMRFQLEKESGKNLGPILGMTSKVVSPGLVKTPMRGQGLGICGSGRNREKCLMRESISDSTQYKNVENALKTHLGTKSEQIIKGLIPLSVRRSWLAIISGDPTSYTKMEARKTTSSKSVEKSTSSSQKLNFLSPHTQEILEAHRVKLWARHNWALPSERMTAMETEQESREVPPLPRTSDQEPGSTSSQARVFSEFPHRVEKESGGQAQVYATTLLLPDCSKNKLHTADTVASQKVGDIMAPSTTDTVASQIADDNMASCTTDTSALHMLGDIMAPSTTDTVASQIADDNMASCTTDTSALHMVGDIMAPSTTDTVASQIADDNMASRTTDASALHMVGDIMAPSTTDTVASQIADDNMVSHSTDTSALHMVGDIMVQHGNSTVGQQKVTIPKQQVSMKGQGKAMALTYQGEDNERPSTLKNQNSQDQSKMLTPAYQDEDGKRLSKEEQEERPEVIQVKEKEDNLKDTYHQPLPKMTQVPRGGPFQKIISRFLKWIRPKKAINGEEKHTKKGNPTPATPKTLKGGKKKPRVDSNVAEAQQLMTAVGQMLEKKMTLQQKLCAPNVNKQRESPLVYVSPVPYGHGPVTYSKQRRAPGYTGNPYQRNSVLDKRVREEQPVKKGQFNIEKWTLLNHSLRLSHRPVNLVNPSPAGRVPMRRVSRRRLSSQHTLLRTVLQRNFAASAVEYASLHFPNRKTYPKKI